MPKRLTVAEFISKAKKVHGLKYDYSKSVYINSHTKISIICINHGKFIQIPNTHLSGAGCPKCAREKLSNMYKDSLDDFKEKANRIH